MKAKLHPQQDNLQERASAHEWHRPVADVTHSESAAGAATGPVLRRLPAGSAARSLRQQAVRQMQQSRGNAFVQRALIPPSIQQEDDAPSSPPTETAETDAPTELSADGSVVRVGAGGVEIQGGMVNVDAAMTRVSGVLNTDTLVAQSVVSSSYTPGVGNIY